MVALLYPFATWLARGSTIFGPFFNSEKNIDQLKYISLFPGIWCQTCIGNRKLYSSVWFTLVCNSPTAFCLTCWSRGTSECSPLGNQQICRSNSGSAHFHVSWLSDFIFYPKPLYKSVRKWKWNSEMRGCKGKLCSTWV
jgi:hypothetical protein